MKNYRFKILILLATVSSITGIATVSAQPWQRRDKIDLSVFIKEIVSIKVSANRAQSAIWLPFEFYIEANRIQGKSTEQIEKELAPLKPYLVFMVQCSAESPDTSLIYESIGQLHARAILKSKNGSETKPLTKIPKQLSVRLEAIKSLMSQDSPRSAANMHILVFPRKNTAGVAIVNTNTRDKLTLVLNEGALFKKAVFTWRTPFDALTQEVICPRCRENASAKWHYCPWCGNKLQSRNF